MNVLHAHAHCDLSELTLGYPIIREIEDEGSPILRDIAAVILPGVLWAGLSLGMCFVKSYRNLRNIRFLCRIINATRGRV